VVVKFPHPKKNRKPGAKRIIGDSLGISDYSNMKSRIQQDYISEWKTLTSACIPVSFRTQNYSFFPAANDSFLKSFSFRHSSKLIFVLALNVTSA